MIALGAGTLGLVLAALAAFVPYSSYLRSPDLVYLAAGLGMLASGIVLLRSGAIGLAGWLVVGSSYAWFVPSIDNSLWGAGLLHVALLVHSVVVVGSARVNGLIERAAVGLGYVAASTAVLGGFRAALPLAGLGVVIAGLATGRELPARVRLFRAAAALVLGGGLLVDAGLRLALSGAERWIAVNHPVDVAVTAGLVALAGTQPRKWRDITLRESGSGELAATVAAELNVYDLEVALSDGTGGWLEPLGEARDAPDGDAILVRDSSGRTCAALEGATAAAVPAAVADLLELAARNAQLRHSILRQVDELEESRLRLLHAADSERSTLSAQLHGRIVTVVSAMERDLAREPSLEAARRRAKTTRTALNTIARGIDPLGHEGSLCTALSSLADTAACQIVIEHCDDPVSAEIARALWYCCAESAANTAKHAEASALTIAVRRDQSTLIATMSDDGMGGARSDGTGVRGIADRVETLGGTFSLSSPKGIGTTITVVLDDEIGNCGQPQPEVLAASDSESSQPSYRLSTTKGGTP